jgi:hypothetical protein
VTCNDGNACTRDFCDQAGGCQAAPEPDGLACNDANACTTGEVCRSGECGGGVPRSCDDGNLCTADSCTPATGACKSVPACDDGNPCTRDSCSTASGACGHVNEPEGLACTDVNRCTTGDACRLGECIGQPVNCNDGDACTTDTCAPATGLCSNLPLSCDDGDVCTLDFCASASGQCSHQPVGADGQTQIELPGPFAIQWLSGRLGWFNLYRGTIPDRGMGSRAGPYDHVCLESADMLGDGFGSSLDPGLPAAASAFYYVLAPENDCAEGPPGVSSANIPRPLLQPCVAGP